MVDIRTAVRSESLNKSSDYEPVITLINKKHQPNETQCKNSQNITRHDSGLDDTSDDEPLTKLERLPRPKKATVQAKGQGTTYIKRGTGNGIQKTKNKIAGSTQDEDSYDSSDNEPLIKMVKQTSLPFKKRPFNTAREVNDVKSRNNVQNTQNICTDSSGDSSDNVPLIKMVDKLKTQTRTKTLPTTARETPKSSDDSSEDEPLINLTRSPSKDTVRTILKSCVAKESNSNNCSERKGKTSREEEVNSDSDDEPLISLVKKPLKAVKKTTTPAKKSVPGKTNKAVNRWSTNIVQSTSEGSLDDRLDDELLIKKMVRNPSMKTLMVILERCETKEALEDYYRANVGNAGERSAAMAEKRNRSQDCSDDEPLIKMVGSPES
ncbi:DNA mismatch repair protein Msh3 isoform X2 [Oncorhynchus mykiss]|uniref:DNA mismatch repair protein Msh3 isoform X2 n=1 Tax=Oncorhynchus mykiss TaxID=8022 RepID=UPI001878DE0A|nr:DNA mismatch repair protein Msh3 isoform X2 [Oncorhynchus mykiss]